MIKKKKIIASIMIILILITLISINFYPESERNNDNKSQQKNLVSVIETRITFDNNNHSYPVIYDNLIAWIQTTYYGSPLGDIFVTNLDNNETRQLTSDSNNSHLLIYEDIIIWSNIETLKGFVYNYTQDRIVDELDFVPTQIYKNKLIYNDYEPRYQTGSDDDLRTHVHLYDLNSKSDMIIKTVDYYYFDIELYGNTFIWTKGRGENIELYTYNINTKVERKISENISDPNIFEKNITFNQIIYSEDGTPIDEKFMLYNYQNNTTKELYNEVTHPMISKNLIVFYEDIYHYGIIDFANDKNYTIKHKYEFIGVDYFSDNKIAYVTYDFNNNKYQSDIVLIEFVINTEE